MFIKTSNYIEIKKLYKIIIIGINKVALTCNYEYDIIILVLK